MEEIKTFKVCSDYKREDLDFAKIQMAEGNPLDKKGYPLYPYLMPSSHGSSFTYKINKDWFFKRKLQDGDAPLNIFSQHHFNQAYNELFGSFDDLGEVIAYFLAKNIIDPKTQKPIIFIPEYRLATFTDKENITFRGCISKNICENNNEELITMATVLKYTNLTGNSIEEYMTALKKYASIKQCNCDFDEVRRTLILQSYFCWKIANSDNHKQNIILIQKRLPNNTFDLYCNGLIDNGSAYELSSPYLLNSDNPEPRFKKLLENPEFSSLDENGNPKFDFAYYPYMHTAFRLNENTLKDKNMSINNKSFSYEYSLASEMLDDNELFRLVYQIDKQLDIQNAIDSINNIYGTENNSAKKSVNWPPFLKEFMFETNNVKSKTLAFIVADYYLTVAYNELIEKGNKENPSKLYQVFREKMLALPLQASKTNYDAEFLKIANSLNINIDESKLESLKFKLDTELSKVQQLS